MAKKTYILTIEYNNVSEEVEYIQEEIIDNESKDTSDNGYILDREDLIEQWNQDSIELIKSLYIGEVGES